MLKDLPLTSCGPRSASFQSAKPVWLAGKKTEKNCTAGFRALFPAPTQPGCHVAIAASSLYRVFLNGEFVGHGPARGPHGHYRVDIWSLDARIKPGENLIAIEVAGYNVNSYYLLDQPSFLQAELVADGAVVAATMGHGSAFVARQIKERVQKVVRYSFQRPFTEAYKMRAGHDAWRRSAKDKFIAEEVSEQSERWLIPRRVPHARFERRQPSAIVSSGKLQTGAAVERIWKDRSRTDVGPKLEGFPDGEIETDPSLEWQQVLPLRGGGGSRPFRAGEAMPSEEKSYRVFDFGTNLTGFIGARLSVKTAAKVFMVFDEILSGPRGGLIEFNRGGCVDIVAYELSPGEYELESFEPYTLRYLQIAVLAGECTFTGVHLREYANDSVWEAAFACDDRRLNEVFAAGRETFRQNAIDIFMDCPSRERAGWLCDSFFTARVAFDLCGDASIEASFIENFLLPERFEHLPDGMLPMCYPADHNDGIFIPNWALWFVVELEEYLARSNDRALIDALKPKVMALFAYFERLVNADGLLEKLESWVFLEWSKANEFTQDVNYPSNMLFARALEVAGKLYHDEGLRQRAERVRETIRAQSYDGSWFVDNAVRTDGKLVRTANRSEVCQYYAFFLGTASPETHPALWKTLASEFGPDRIQRGAHTDIHPVNAFIGTYLRLELLSTHGRGQQLLDEAIGWFHEMAKRTGTLWENLSSNASCNHGFASHIVHALYRDALGVRAVDPIGKTVRIRLGGSTLGWCEGRIPCPGGAISVTWWKDGKTVRYRADAPSGYRVEVTSEQGAEIVADS